jgi:hypothetical protein
MDHFISWSFDHFDEFSLSLSLWESLSRRLLLRVVPSQHLITEYRKTRLRYPTSFIMPETSLDGIIAELTGQCGGNVHDKGIVEISSKSMVHDSGQYHAKYAADLHAKSYFQSSNSPDQWIQYDFKTRRVRPTHYTIFAHLDFWWPRSWVLEGSLKGSDDSWEELDRHEGDTTMNMEHTIGTFPVRKSGEYRFIRLQQTGKNKDGNNEYLILFGFEIFGDLLEPSLN